MDVLTAINSRASAARLTEPGPSAEQLEIILGAGVRAPDHGRIAPWRFVVLAGQDRNILAKAMVARIKRTQPNLATEEVEREGFKVQRAPTIIVVAAKTGTPGKIPDVERILAVGAAVQNMWLAIHALGLGAMWKTGEPAYDGAVKTALGLEPTDHIVAFLYVGTIAAPGTPRETRFEGAVVRP